MAFTLAVDDHTDGFASRASTRQKLLDHISNPPELEKLSLVPDAVDASPAEVAEFYRRRDAELRATWGHDPAAQAPWIR